MGKELRLNRAEGSLADVDCVDFAIMQWIRAHKDVSGVYWLEVFDPVGLSAPRGALFPEKLEQWKVEEIKNGTSDDEAIHDFENQKER